MSNPGRPWKCGFFAVAAVFMLAWFPLRIPAEEYRSPSDGIQSMEYAEGRLSLEAQDASLDKVLRELSRMAKLTVIADGPIEGRITLHADHLPLEKALRKILRGIDTSFVYTAKAETSPKEYEIKQVRIYVSNGEKGEPRRYSFAGDAEGKSGGALGRHPGPACAPEAVDPGRRRPLRCPNCRRWPRATRRKSCSQSSWKAISTAWTILPRNSKTRILR